MADKSKPKMWAGEPSRVLHLPRRGASNRTTACGRSARPVTEVTLPLGTYTDCTKCLESRLRVD